MSFTSILETDFQSSTITRAVLQDAPMSLPFSKELDLLAKLGDLFWQSLNGGHCMSPRITDRIIDGMAEQTRFAVDTGLSETAI